MNYYHIEFFYPGPYVGFPGDDEESIAASRVNHRADDKVAEAANKIGVEMVHAYAWPDGSLYKFFRCNLEINDLRQALNKELKKDDMAVAGIWVENAEKEHWNKTLKECFDEKL